MRYRYGVNFSLHIQILFGTQVIDVGFNGGKFPAVLCFGPEYHV